MFYLCQQKSIFRNNLGKKTSSISIIYSLNSINDNLFLGTTMLGCSFVTTPVKTVVLPSRMLNRCPVLTTMGSSVVNRAPPCSPGISIFFPFTIKQSKTESIPFVYCKFQKEILNDIQTHKNLTGTICAMFC